MNVTLNITTDSLDDAIATLAAIRAGLGFDPRQVAAGATDPAAGATSSQSVTVDAGLAQGIHSDDPAAPPPPVAEADAAAAQAEHVAAGAPDDEGLDARGMPWDARIHASTKSKLANGNWKNKRGVDAAELAAVEAELLSTNAPTPPPPAPAAEPQQAATPPPPAAATPSAEKVETFPQLMHFIQAKGITPGQYVPMLQAFNLAALPDLLKPENAGVIPQLHAALAGA